MGSGISSQRQALFERIQAHDEAGCLALLRKKGVDVNAKIDAENGLYEVGYTPLLAAAREGLERVCLRLIELGAAVSAREEGTQEKQVRDSVLSYAAKSGLDSVCDAVIEQGCTSSSHIDLALLRAAEHGHCNLCVQLVRHGANVNAKDPVSKDSVLMRATGHGDGWTCSAMIRLGASINSVNRRGETAFHFASRTGNVSVCLDLLNLGAWVNAPDKKGQTPLMHAAADGRVEMCEELLKMGATQLVDLKGNTVLMHAVRTMKAELNIVNELIRRGGDVHARNTSGETALMMAARLGHESICSALVRAGADPFLAARSGACALEIAQGDLRASILSLYKKQSTRRSVTPRESPGAEQCGLMLPGITRTVTLDCASTGDPSIYNETSFTSSQSSDSCAQTSLGQPSVSSMFRPTSRQKLRMAAYAPSSAVP